MNIIRIDIQRVAIPFETGGPRVGMRPGLRAWTEMESLLVRVETADGIIGWGEAFGHFVNAGTQAILQHLVCPWFIGKDPSDISSLMEDAQRAFFGFGRNGPVMYALSAMDIALWDIAAQRANQPLFRLLGGHSGELRLYASLLRFGGDTDAVARNVARARDSGYTLVKLHERTIPAFMAAHKAMGDIGQVALDVNAPWTTSEARNIAASIRDSNFAWLEEPVWPPEDFEAAALVRQESVPIAGGENIGTLLEFQYAFKAGAFDVIQPSVAKIGGISEMTRVYSAAQKFPVKVIPHCFYWGPGYLATAHFIASLPVPTFLETAYIKFERQPYALFNPDRATLSLPESPGLGFEPDYSVLDAYTISSVSVSENSA